MTERSRVLLTRRIPSASFERLSSATDVDLYEGPSAMPAEELRERIKGEDGLICVLTDKVTKELLEVADRLKIVANIAVGYDNIDVPAVKAKNVVVTNTPDVLTEATAELTWALILSAARRVAEGDRLIRRHGWKGWALDFMLGTELRGKQLGIIGRGRIGRAVAAKAPAFGMHAVFAKHDMSFDELLISSDVISIHTPMTPENRHMIDRRALAQDEADCDSREHGAWSDRGRRGAGMGAERAPDRSGGARRLSNVSRSCTRRCWASRTWCWSRISAARRARRGQR